MVLALKLTERYQLVLQINLHYKSLQTIHAYQLALQVSLLTRRAASSFARLAQLLNLVKIRVKL